MAMIFNGRELAKKKEEELKRDGGLVGKSLLVLQTGEKENVFVRLKRQMGERLGVKMGVVVCGDKEELKKKLVEMRDDYDGVMVQLPVAGANEKEKEEILNLIPENKDVDGLIEEKSGVTPAVVRAMMRILEEGLKETGKRKEEVRVAVVGSRGFVGSSLVRNLKSQDFKVEGFDEGDDLSGLVNFEVVMTAVGKKGLIGKDTLVDGVIVIDAGYPEADIERGVEEKASLITPVPGGVGPVTVVSLFENLLRL